MTPVRTRRPRPAAATSDEDVLESLHSTVASVFGQVQHSVAVHRKHQVSLNEVHKRCCEIVGQRPDGTLRLVGEKAFLETFLASLNRVLAIKRAEAVAERCIRFAASYTAYAQEAFRPEGLAPGEDYDETPAERFSEKLLKHLMRGFGAKDKNVRFRCVELVALLVMELKAIDDDIFVLLKAMLKERIFDKEAYVRVHAVIAMGSLQGGGDPSGQDEEAEEVRSILLWLLRHDPSADVRRAVLFNLAKTQDNLPFILERKRDVDILTRRSVFVPQLANLPPESWVGASAAPTPKSDGVMLDGQLTNNLILEGLRDREMPVQTATKRLLSTWVSQGNNDLISFLNHFDLLAVEDEHDLDYEDEEEAEMVLKDPSRSGIAVAQHALHVIFDAQPNLAESVALVGQEADQSDTVWAQLTPAKALLAKMVLEHWQERNNLTQFENGMPAMTALAFRIQKHFNMMLEAAEQAVASERLVEEEDDEEASDVLASKRLAQQSEETVVHLLMQVVLMADFGDEIGRRKVFGLVREMLSGENALMLSETLLTDCLDLLAKLADSQADLVRIVVEIVQQLEEEEDEEDEQEVENETLLGTDPGLTQASDVSKSHSRKTRQPRASSLRDPLALRARNICRLIIVRLMLERVGGPNAGSLTNALEGPLKGLLSGLIAPSLRAHEKFVRWHGMRALGLYCLLDRSMAQDTLLLFLEQIKLDCGDAIRECAVSAIFDLILVHGLTFLASKWVNIASTDPTTAAVELRKAYGQMFTMLKVLLEDDSPRVAATVALGIGKLMLAGVMDVDPNLVQDALTAMVLVYMAPHSEDNIDLRQCLSYFLPAYCYSSRSNQRALHTAWMDILRDLTDVYYDEEPEPDSPPRLTPQQIALQLIDWMDASKAAYPGEKDEGLNLHVLSDILSEVLLDQTHERKLYISLLGKVHLPDTPPDESVYAALVLADIIASPTAWQVALNMTEHSRGKGTTKVRPASRFDTAAHRNTFTRFHTGLKKKYKDYIGSVDYRKILTGSSSGSGGGEEHPEMENSKPSNPDPSEPYGVLRELLNQTDADVELLVRTLEADHEDAERAIEAEPTTRASAGRQEGDEAEETEDDPGEHKSKSKSQGPYPSKTKDKSKTTPPLLSDSAPRLPSTSARSTSTSARALSSSTQRSASTNSTLSDLSDRTRSTRSLSGTSNVSRPTERTRSTHTVSGASAGSGLTRSTRTISESSTARRTSSRRTINREMDEEDGEEEEDSEDGEDDHSHTPQPPLQSARSRSTRSSEAAAPTVPRPRHAPPSSSSSSKSRSSARLSAAPGRPVSTRSSRTPAVHDYEEDGDDSFDDLL